MPTILTKFKAWEVLRDGERALGGEEEEEVRERIAVIASSMGRERRGLGGVWLVGGSASDELQSIGDWCWSLAPS